VRPVGYARDEIQHAFDRFVDAAAVGGRTGDWSEWVACFTPEVSYVEHHYGEMQGRDAVQAWITETMNQWPMTHMQEFPWDWYTIDAEQGFVVGQVQNRFVDPGDGNVYESANWTRLVYAGEGLFSSEEDVYNPAHFAPVVRGWMEAYAAAHPDQPAGATRP
jgi:hypothetical protein